MAQTFKHGYNIGAMIQARRRLLGRKRIDEYEGVCRMILTSIIMLRFLPNRGESRTQAKSKRQMLYKDVTYLLRV